MRNTCLLSGKVIGNGGKGRRRRGQIGRMNREERDRVARGKSGARARTQTKR